MLGIFTSRASCSRPWTCRVPRSGLPLLLCCFGSNDHHAQVSVWIFAGSKCIGKLQSCCCGCCRLQRIATLVNGYLLEFTVAIIAMVEEVGPPLLSRPEPCLFGSLFAHARLCRSLLSWQRMRLRKKACRTACTSMASTRCASTSFSNCMQHLSLNKLLFHSGSICAESFNLISQKTAVCVIYLHVHYPEEPVKVSVVFPQGLYELASKRPYSLELLYSRARIGSLCGAKSLVKIQRSCGFDAVVPNLVGRSLSKRSCTITVLPELLFLSRVDQYLRRIFLATQTATLTFK